MRTLHQASLVSTVLLGAASLAHAEPWTHAYVVEWFEPAFYYGAKEGDAAPGTDCPAGTNPEMDWRKVLKTSYRTDADVDKILDPENPQRPKVGGIRGPNQENVYEIPWAVPDPGLVGVSGDLAYGFNLDGNPRTGFKGANGERGIDNEYYKAIGCLSAWRGPTRQGHHAKYVMDGMRDGRFTVLLVVSGNGADPKNDADVHVAFYMSKDKMVKDANGDIAHDYTFRVAPDPKFQSTVSARTVNGVIETIAPVEIVTRSVDGLPLVLDEARLRLEPQPDGSLIGLTGGYRSIDDYYAEWAAGGAIYELTMHINTPAYWYALQRNADGMFDAQRGRYTGISTAYRYYAVPAFVITPDATQVVRATDAIAGESPPDNARAMAATQSRRPRVNIATPPVEALPAQKKKPPKSYVVALRR